MVGSGRRGGSGGGAPLGVLPGAAADRDVSKNTSFSPVPSTALAEVARLREVVVIVIAEFGVCRIAPWTL